MLIDVDFHRPAGISATDEEVEAAGAVARRLRAYLTAAGWPGCVLVMSGNGWHLLYRVDLPNDDASRDLVKRLLERLAKQFNSDGVEVDTSVFNAARIVKVPGTWVCKGDDLADRPHRQSYVADRPGELQAVDVALLEAIAGPAPAAKASSSTYRDNGHSEFDVEEWMARYGLAVRKHKADAGGEVWEMEVCPFNAEHSLGEPACDATPAARVGRLPALALLLHVGRAARALRAGVQGPPDHGHAGHAARETPPAAPAADAPDKAGSGASWGEKTFLVLRRPDVTLSRPVPIIPGRAYRGSLAMIGGRQGDGKGKVKHDLWARATNGGPWPFGDTRKFKPLTVVDIDAEDDPGQTIFPEYDRAGADYDRLHVIQERKDGMFPDLTDPRQLEQLEELIGDLHADIVSIDPVGHFFSGIKYNETESVIAKLSPLMRIAQRTRCVIVPVTHFNKALSADALAKFLGSGQWTAVARSANAVVLDPNNKDDELRAPRAVDAEMQHRSEARAQALGLRDRRRLTGRRWRRLGRRPPLRTTEAAALASRDTGRGRENSREPRRAPGCEQYSVSAAQHSAPATSTEGRRRRSRGPGRSRKRSETIPSSDGCRAGARTRRRRSPYGVVASRALRGADDDGGPDDF